MLISDLGFKYKYSFHIYLLNLKKTKKMSSIKIIPTQNPAILKFVLPNFITQGESYEFKNIDETAVSPLAKELFYLPFVKTVYISGDFIAIERFSIVEWEDVQEQVAEQIQNFVDEGNKIIINSEKKVKKTAFTVYAESTPNPTVMKFVSNKLLTKKVVEYKSIDEAVSSPLAKKLFEFPFVKEVFVDENYVSITKYDSFDWNDLVHETRSFIKNFLEEGHLAVDESLLTNTQKIEAEADQHFDNLDETSQRIVNILEEYVKPAVASDGGNIVFKSYDTTTNTAHVILQGACSGCPSSTFTLKNGIETMLRQMLQNESLLVEAYNG